MTKQSKEALAETLAKCGEFALLVSEQVSWAGGRSSDSATVKYLEWMNAMTPLLKDLKVRAPEKNAEHAFLLGYNLHAIPLWFGEPSILDHIRRHLADRTTWRHVVTLLDAVILQTGFPPLRILPGVIEASEKRRESAAFPFPHDPEQAIYLPTIESFQHDIAFNQAICHHLMTVLTASPTSPKEWDQLVREIMMDLRHAASTALAGP